MKKNAGMTGVKRVEFTQTTCAFCMDAPLAARLSPAQRLLLPVVIVIFAVVVGLPGHGIWLVLGTLKMVLTFGGFVLLFAGSFLWLIHARERLQKLLDHSQKWQEAIGLHGPQGPQQGGSNYGGIATSDFSRSIVTLPPFTHGLPDLKMKPVDILFTNYQIPYEISQEFGPFSVVVLLLVTCLL